MSMSREEAMLIETPNAGRPAVQARSRALEGQAANERDQAAQARAQEAASVERIKAAEADIAAARARIALVDRALAVQRTRVAERQDISTALLDAQRTTLRDQLVNDRRSEFFDAYMRKAREKMTIEYNQALVDQLVAQQ